MGAWGCWGWVGQQLVDLSGDVAFEAADGFSAGFALLLSFLHICDCGLVVACPGGGDAP